VTSDGAANILKALSDAAADHTIDDSHRCVCHTLHLIVTKALSEKGVKDILTEFKALTQLFRKSNLSADVLKKTQMPGSDMNAPLTEQEGAIPDLPNDPDIDEYNEKYIGNPLKLHQDVVTIAMVINVQYATSNAKTEGQYQGSPRYLGDNGRSLSAIRRLESG
jgi:hypothetical protein